MQTVSNTRIFIDTNILCYSNAPESEFGSAARSKLKELVENGNTLIISTQVVREYAQSH